MTYWEAAYILEHGSVHYGQIKEAEAIALMVLKEQIKKLDETEDAKLREPLVKGPLYGNKSDAIIIDEWIS